MTATSARRDAIVRLIDICQAGWDPDLLLARGAAVAVLCRRALRAAAGDEQLLAEVRDLCPVASGRPEPLIDAALHGLPADHAPATAAWTVDDLRDALR